MKKSTVFGLIAGFAAGVAAAVVGKTVVDKTVSEIKSDLREQSFTSPEGDHHVTLSYGSSDTAKGLTYVKIKASADCKEDTCKLVALAKKSDELFSGEWDDNDHFTLLIGGGKRKQCCDVDFTGDEIEMLYYLQKDADAAPAEVAEIAEEAAEEEIEAIQPEDVSVITEE